MALHDDEQRKLAEIERRLGEENPRLAQRFAGSRLIPDTTLVRAVPALVMVVFGGIVLIVVGIQLRAPVLVILGVLVLTGVPAVAGWWLRHRHTPPQAR